MLLNFNILFVCLFVCFLNTYLDLDKIIFFFISVLVLRNFGTSVLTRTRKYDHISPVLLTLHWLPIKHCIDFKIMLIIIKPWMV